MFFLMYKKYSLLPLQTRLLAGFSALVIILIILSGLIFNLFILDKISLYANRDTVLYFKLDLNKNGDYYQDRIISQILKAFDLSDLDRHLLNKDLAVICSSPQRHLRCQLLIRSGSVSAIKALLDQKKILSQRLSHGIIAIGITETPFKKTYNPLTYLKFQGLAFNKNLLIVALPPDSLNSDLEKSLAFLPSLIKLYGRTENRGIIINDNNSGLNKKTTDDSTIDILISTDNAKKNQTTPLKYLTGETELNLLTDLFSSKKFSLAMNKKSDQGGILVAYDFFIRSDYRLQPTEAEALEKSLINLAQSYQTQEKNIYLNDGTKVTLLNRDTNLAFTDSDAGFRILSLNNGQTIYYGYQNNNLVIGNNKDFQPIPELLEDNTIKIRLSSLSNNNWLKKYLNDFSFLEVNNNQITLK